MNPFTLGVASGYPSPDGFVLWTRLAPTPLAQDGRGGIPPGDVSVRYLVATDPDMTFIVTDGQTIAREIFAHSVHVSVEGLSPGTRYWYRFQFEEHQSTVGRTLTLPAKGQSVSSFKIGVVSCSHYEFGYFSAYRRLAEEDPDIVLFVGDYIYEYVERERDSVNPRPTVRSHSGGTMCQGLASYRNRHAQYKTDVDLQLIHASCPCMVVWDDHDVFNNYANRWSTRNEPVDVFLTKRASAFQAFYEHLPLMPMQPDMIGPSLKIYTSCSIGDLIDLWIIDARQYRSFLGAWDLVDASTHPQIVSDSTSILGWEQENWLYRGLRQSKSKWRIIGQAQMMCRLVMNGKFSPDGWDGYHRSRRRLLKFILDNSVKDVVSLGGDLHSFWANELSVSSDGVERVVATEFVGTSVSAPVVDFSSWVQDNPRVRYHNASFNGYLLATITRDEVKIDMRGIRSAVDPDSSVSTIKSFSVLSGLAKVNKN